MDDLVRQALAKWPNVPHCYGWLALDERGDWYMRDDRIQAQGPFPHPKGSRIAHDKLLAFIHRNYDHDEQGAWFFQNGPQRVYVELALTPWVLRLSPGGAGAPPGVHTHTGLPFSPAQALSDAQGRLYLDDGRHVGVLHSMDMGLLAESAQEQGGSTWLALSRTDAQPVRLRVRPCAAAELPQRYGYCLRPLPPAEPATPGSD